MPSKTMQRLSEILTDELRSLKTVNFWRMVVSELIATFWLMFVAIMTSVKWTDPNKLTYDPTATALAVGFTAMGLIECFGHISGCHMNPAVTLAFGMVGEIYPIKALFYVTAQFLGCVGSAGMVYALVPEARHGRLGVMEKNSEVTVWQALGMEILITFGLVTTFWGAIEHRYKSISLPTWPIAAAVAVGIYIGFYSSGGCMNPARPFGSSVVAWEWPETNWILYVGPCLGSILGTTLYKYLLIKAAMPTPEKEKLPDTIKEMVANLHNIERSDKARLSNNSLHTCAATIQNREHLGEHHGAHHGEGLITSGVRLEIPQNLPNVNYPNPNTTKKPCTIKLNPDEMVIDRVFAV